MNNEMWEFTPRGHKPKFQIKCVMCGTPMRLRYSQVFRPSDVFQALEDPSRKMGLTAEERVEILQKNGWAEDRAYKCPNCQWWTIFGIPLAWEELLELRKVRKRSIYVPVEEWAEDHPIRKKLAAMGYW